MTMLPNRLWAPVLTAGVGLALAAGALVAAGWAAAAPVAGVALVSATGYWWLSGTDTDVGALIGARADERQELVRLRVRVFAAVALFALATIGALVSAALHRTAWPCAAVVGLGAGCFLAGLGYYRASTRTSDLGLGRADGRLDERQAAVVLHALQLSGVAMFFAAIAGGLGFSGHPAATPLRILASVFAAAVLVGFAVYRPR
ncbi:MAG: hypothetical protein ACRDLK_13175 [Gaiellaceae bacterium]